MKVFGVIGWKNSGKTGLMERLVQDITARGFTVSTLKHAHHRFDVDQKGKDSYRHRLAGAREVLLSSGSRWALMHELRTAPEPAPEPALTELLKRLSPCDLVLIEGYKRDNHPKIEANRAATKQSLIAPTENTVLAVASDQSPDQIHADLDIPLFDLDDTTGIADFILRHVGLIASPENTDAPPAATPPARAPPQRGGGWFSLPAGVNWMPVDDALAILRRRLDPVIGQETLAVTDAAGRVLATDQTAPRSNPPAANSAIDGYGFAAGGLNLNATGNGPHILPLLPGRAAAGAPFQGAVPRGQALRVLTGALLPEGVDTVVLQEDITSGAGHVAFNGPVRAGANTRRAGEDLQKGQLALTAGQVLRPPDLALLTGLGLADVTVFTQLRVGVLSTGDEIVAADNGQAPAHQTYDANRPMLLSLAQRWGYLPVDLGHVNDDRQLLKSRLDHTRGKVDVILTSGGASAGEEDHVSALLQEQGALQAWRIALKPGRPLALGIWQGVPVFGLPGNPVAALVCALIFARPALSVLAGAGWSQPQGYMVPAAFEKTKKPGRREYLRARMTPDGRVQAFASEGSGRISGLAWATGLVELSDAAQTIAPGTMVRYLPYASFGL